MGAIPYANYTILVYVQRISHRLRIDFDSHSIAEGRRSTQGQYHTRTITCAMIPHWQAQLAKLPMSMHHHAPRGSALPATIIPPWTAVNLQGLHHSFATAFCVPNVRGVLNHWCISRPTTEALVPLLSVTSTTLLFFWIELRLGNLSSKDRTAACQGLESHKKEKSTILLKNLPGALLVSLAAVVITHVSPWLKGFWEFGPNPALYGWAFSFWAAEVTMDCCLDECRSAKPYATVVLTLFAQLWLVFKLTTKTGGGHVLFLFKAAETLVATALARTIDNVLWAGVAILCFSMLTTSSLLGLLPALPPSLPLGGWMSYLLVTVGSSIFYQLAQNVSSAATAKIFHMRAVGHIVALMVGAPATWVLFDTWNFTIFLCWKVLVDMVASNALKKAVNKPIC